MVGWLALRRLGLFPSHLILILSYLFWFADLWKHGLEPHYENDGRIISDGFKDGYVFAHYQSPAEMTCLWREFQETKRSLCCHGW